MFQLTKYYRYITPPKQWSHISDILPRGDAHDVRARVPRGRGSGHAPRRTPQGGNRTHQRHSPPSGVVRREGTRSTILETMREADKDLEINLIILKKR